MLLLLLVMQTQSPLAVRADTVHPAHDAVHYDITLVPSDTNNHVLVEVETAWRLKSKDLVGMELDSTMRVIRVLVDGKPESRMSRTMYARSSEAVEVPHEKLAGDTLSTRVRYHGLVSDGLIIGKNQYGDRTIFADNWPDRAHLWLASQDTPSDKATVAFHVQAPVADQVIANGVLEKVDTLPYGHAVWHYRLDQPIPVYTMVVGIGRLTRTRLPDANCAARCVPISVWAYPQDSAYAVGDPFRRANKIVDFFSDLLGPFPYPTLAHVESSTHFGGMENATAIFYDEKRYGTKNLGEQVVAHETAHQWFGDAVTEADWHHLWLSEGFATYMASLWLRQAAGDSAFRAEMREHADEIFDSKDTERPIIDPEARRLLGLLNSNNYQKGAWVLHQLRGLTGDSAFYAGLRLYYRTYRDSTALSSDFARVMSQGAGTDLGWYFRQALTQPGYPVLDVRWKHKGKRLLLDITETQKPEWGTYRLPNLEILVDGRPFRINVDGRQTQQTIEGVPHKPKKVEVDPNGWWLLQTKSVSEK